MSWILRNPKILIVSPNLPYNLPFVHKAGTRLAIMNSKKNVYTPFTNYEEWKSLVESWGYRIYSFKELSNLLGEVLVEISPSTFIVEGNDIKVFPNFSSFCEFKDIARYRLYKDLSKGLTFETVFSDISKYLKSSRYTNDNFVYDHLDNKFDNYSTLEQHYGLTKGVVPARLKAGWSLKKAITTPIVTYTTKDHLGREFPSKRAMAKFYGLSLSSLEKRLSRGMSLEEALTTPRKR